MRFSDYIVASERRYKDMMITSCYVREYVICDDYIVAGKRLCEHKMCILWQVRGCMKIRCVYCGR